MWPFTLACWRIRALKVRLIADCPRLLCAAPAYIARRGMPEDGAALVRDKHDCLNLRFPGAKEFQWTLQTPEGPRRYEITGPFESDDGDVLTGWALDGRGIVLKADVRGGRPSARGPPGPGRHRHPAPAHATVAVSPHRSAKDTKVRLFTDFMVARVREEMRKAGG